MTERYQLMMIAHGAMVMLAGMIAGIFFTFHLLGEMTLSPLPLSWDLNVPGSARGWRAAHVGSILNGMMVLGVGAVLPRVSLSAGAQRFVVYGLIATGWANVLFYFFGNFAPNRGLSMGSNPLGEASWSGVLAFVPALTGSVLVIIALVLIIRATLGKLGEGA